MHPPETVYKMILHILEVVVDIVLFYKRRNWTSSEKASKKCRFICMHFIVRFALKSGKKNHCTELMFHSKTHI